MPRRLASLLLILAMGSATAAEVVLEDWDTDFGEWTAQLSREGENPELLHYEIVSGTLEVKVPATQVSILRHDLDLPTDAVRLSVEVTPLGKGFKEIEVGMAIYSAGKALDPLGRTRVAEGTGMQVVSFPVNAMTHIGSSWNRLAIRIYCETDAKVRLDNLKAVLRK